MTADELLGLQAIWGDDSHVTLDFGDSPYSIRKHFIRGDTTAALNYLVAETTQIVSQPVASLPAMESAEKRLLGLVKEVKPIASADTWSIYRIDYPTTMVVGVQKTGRESSSGDTNAARVICWGIVLPVENQWSIFMIEPTRDSEMRMPFAGAVPPNARRTLSLKDEHGAFIMGISGAGPMDEWVGFFSNEFSGKGWLTDREWTHAETQSSARFSFESNGLSHWVDVQLTATAGERHSGLIVVTPRREAD